MKDGKGFCEAYVLKDDETYAQHLRLAEYLTRWGRDLDSELDGRSEPRDEADFLLGYQRALLDMAGHLRERDALPGGILDALTLPVDA